MDNFNGYNNQNYNDMSYQNNYSFQLYEAQKKEKKGLMINAAKLGFLLLLYNILNEIFIVVYYYLVYFIVNKQFAFSYNAVLRDLSQRRDLVESSLFSMCGNGFVVLCSAIVLMIIAKICLKINFREMMKPKSGHGKMALLWFPLCMTLNIVVSIITNIFTNVMEQTGIQVPESDFSIKNPTTITILIQIAYVVIVGPVCEEIIYRGVILTLLKPYGKGVAIFFSALIFGLMHGNIAQATSAFASGLIFAAVAIQCNSIIPTIFIHIANNALATLTDITTAKGYEWGNTVYYGLLILLLFMGVYVLFTKWKKLVIQNDNSYAMSTSKRVRAVFLNPLMLVYFAYILWEFIKSFINAN